MTSKTRKNKPTHIEKILPLSKVVDLFHQKFHDPYLNPEAELTIGDFRTAFPEVTPEELEEALGHWVMHPRLRVLSTKTTEVDGRPQQVWYVHGLHEENAEATFSDFRGRIQT